MIWYNNIDAVNAIHQSIAEDYQGSRTVRRSRRGLRLAAATDHATK